MGVTRAGHVSLLTIRFHIVVFLSLSFYFALKKHMAQYTLMCRTSCRNVYSHQIMFKVSCLVLPPKSIPRISFLLLRNIPRSRRLLPMYLGLPSDAFPGKKWIVSPQQGSQCKSRKGVSPYTDRTQLFFFHLPVRSPVDHPVSANCRLAFVLSSWDLLLAGWDLHGCHQGRSCVLTHYSSYRKTLKTWRRVTVDHYYYVTLQQVVRDVSKQPKSDTQRFGDRTWFTFNPQSWSN